MVLVRFWEFTARSLLKVRCGKVFFLDGMNEGVKGCNKMYVRMQIYVLCMYVICCVPPLLNALSFTTSPCQSTCQRASK